MDEWTERNGPVDQTDDPATRLLLHTHPDKYGEERGEKAQAQAATQIIMHLMETLDSMLA